MLDTIIQTIGGYAGIAAILIFAIDKGVKLTATTVDDEIWAEIKANFAKGNLLNSDAKPANDGTGQGPR